MIVNDDSKFPCKNSPPFGLHSSRKIEEAGKKHFQNRRFTTWVGIVIFLFIIFLITFLVYCFTKYSEGYKQSESNKYIVKNESFDNVKVLAQKSTRNVQIIPNFERPERRISQHPNHRYAERESEEKIYKKMMREFHDESGWSPKPFQKQIKGAFNNIQDIITKGEIKNHGAKQKGELREMMKGMGPPMHLKGFYVEPDYVEGDEDESFVDMDGNEYSDNYQYLKEINDLMENERKESRKREKWISKKGYGRPFQLPIKGKEIAPETLKRLETSDSKKKNQWTSPEFRKNKKKSITILLDIYPLMKNYGEFGGKSWHQWRKPQNGVLHLPKRFMNKNVVGSPSSNFPIMYKDGWNGRMIMKLNLYPKNKSRRDANILIKEVAYQGNKEEAEKRTFGLFSKYKKKKHQPKRCSVMSFRPYGKPIKAKWKDENGEWVHAERVTVKRLVR